MLEFLSAPRMLAIAAAVLMLGAGVPAHAESVSCSEIDLTFDAGGDETYCAAETDSGRNAGSEGGWNWGAQWEIIGLDTSGRSIVVELDRANSRTYFEKGDVRADVDVDPWFTDSRSWGEIHRLEGYEAQAFEGTWKGAGGFWKCMGFSRYSRPIARGGAGYAERLIGVYCVAPGHEVDAQAFSRFLGTISY
jgi:hypothetical protein